MDGDAPAVTDRPLGAIGDSLSRRGFLAAAVRADGGAGVAPTAVVRRSVGQVAQGS